MDESTSVSGFKKFLMKISSELVLGTLVALLSVLVALGAYQGSLADAKETDANVGGQKQITEANGLYLEANQFIIYDYSMYDGWYLNTGKNEELAQYYYDSFSESLQTSMEVNKDDPFTDQYYAEMYTEADNTYDAALTFFDQAEAASNRAIRMQLVVLIFAVGLALAAYGSLLPPDKAIRIIFTIGSLGTLVTGLISYVSA
jgi:tetratricopeptide (TPR) repeat protein